MKLDVEAGAAVRLLDLGQHPKLQGLDDLRLGVVGIGARDQRAEGFRHGVAGGDLDRSCRGRSADLRRVGRSWPVDIDHRAVEDRRARPPVAGRDVVGFG